MIRATCCRCNRGQEACEWCHDIDVRDFEAICDCGLHDFGDHLLDCEKRADKAFVVVANYGSESLPRVAGVGVEKETKE